MEQVFSEGLLVTHINIRKSISMLLGQLIFVNILAIILIIGVFLASDSIPQTSWFHTRSFDFSLLLAIFFFLIFLIVYGVLQWLNEYYEINPKSVIHRKGLIFKKEEKSALENIAYISLKQDMLGKLLNYGTITLYDFQRTPNMDLYLIHNPLKHLDVLEKLIPKADQQISSIIGSNKD